MLLKSRSAFRLFTSFKVPKKSGVEMQETINGINLTFFHDAQIFFL